MKKQLLVGAMLMGAFFTANAQYSVSFEDFTVGDLDGQNEWGVSQLAGGGILQNVVITDEMASDGTLSMSMAFDEGAPTDGAFRGAFSPQFEADYSTITSSFDFFITVDEDEETEGADYDVAFQSVGESKLTSRVKMMFDGTIRVIDMGETVIDFIDTGATWTAGEWHTIAVTHDFDADTFTYYLDGEVIFDGTNWNGVSTVDNIAVLHDNFPGTTLFIDNFEVLEGTLGTNEVLASKFSVYPNPATDVINIANAENMLVNGVTITDINGRTVKSAQFEGTTNATVNVSDLASGVYMMTVSSDKGTAVKKIVKN